MTFQQLYSITLIFSLICGTFCVSPTNSNDSGFIWSRPGDIKRNSGDKKVNTQYFTLVITRDDKSPNDGVLVNGTSPG